MTIVTEEDDMTFSMSHGDYARLMLVLGVATGRMMEQPAYYQTLLEFVQKILQLNAKPGELFPPMEEST